MTAERRPPTRDECLAGLQSARPTLIDALQAHGWDTPDADGWTGKDHLAHVVAWQRRLVAWFAEDAAGRSPRCARTSRARTRRSSASSHR